MAVAKKRCKYCKEYKPAADGKQLPIGWVCSLDHGFLLARLMQSKNNEKKISKALKSQAKKSPPKVKVKKVTTRELNKKDKRYQFKLTKSKIQQWVNHIRDAGLPCISCGTTKPDIQYCGGHYKTAGGFPELALNTLNISRQCNQRCNLRLSGNISGDKTSNGYTSGLIERHGQERVGLLNSHHENPRYDCDQLIKIRAYYARLIRDENKDDSTREF